MSSGMSSQAFNKRLKPCQRCKIQRRKCDRSSETADCYRCIKSNRDCIYDDGTGDTGDEVVDGNMDLQKLTQNVASLQESLQRMESYLQQERLAQAHSETNPTFERTTMTWNQLEQPCAVTQNSPYSVYINNRDSTSSSLQLSTIASTSPTPEVSSNVFVSSSDSHHTSATDKDEEYEWKLTFVDGKLRLESSIRSFDELTAYGNALRQYLSPFAGVFNNTAFLFETIQPKSLVPMVIQVISQRSCTRQRTKLLTSNASMWNKYHFMLKRQHPAVLLAAAGKDIPISCIDELVQHYFTCFNPGLPLIHEPSYFAEYETVVRPNPTQHALTMAFCCCICASTCRHLPYNNYERRILADYFYGRAVDLLGDFFDEPDRRLETLMVINFLSQYYQITLRVAEARKWCTIGYMIAKELYQEYESQQMEEQLPTTTTTKEPSSPHSVASATTTTTTASSSSSLSSSSSSYLSSSSSSSSLSFSVFPPLSTATQAVYSTPTDQSHPSTTTAIPSTIPDSKYLSELTQTTTNRDLAIFRRHYIMSICSQKLLNLVLDRNPESGEIVSAKPILYLEDESEMTYAFIGVYNKALQLMTHPVVLELKEQTHRMQLGEKAKVTLELILRFDQVYKDWWNSLPSELRLCDQDPADVSCRSYIENCPNQLQLVVYLLAVIHKAEANIALTKPSNQSSILEDSDLSLVRAIQERALNDAYECVESLALAMKKLELNKVLCIFTSDLLLWVSDLMCTLSASPSASVKGRAQRRSMESLRELRTVRFMEGNLVPPALSPLAFMYSSAKSTKFDYLSTNIIEMYNEYTFPALAFGYDILRMASEGE